MSESPGNRTKSSNIAALERASGREWHEWLAIFESAEASKLSHSAIAKIARAAMPRELENPDWWAQGAAIAFEQQVGIRVPGQSSTGDYRVGASRTVSLDRDAAIERWKALHGESTHHLDQQVSGVRESRTDKRTFWRAALGEVGKLEVAAESKDGGRSIVSVQHTGLSDAEQIEVWRAYWRSRLSEI